MAKERHTSLPQFVRDYGRLRAQEGFASADPAFARALPFRDITGRNVAAWRLRALHYLIARVALRCVPNVHRVLDVGAGNGWLARRLASRYRVTALDVDAGEAGLGCLRDTRVLRVRGDLEALPLGDETFDAVIAAAALHYSINFPRALQEISRVLRPAGVLIIADSPFYSDALARHGAWQRTLEYFTAAGAPHLANRYQGLTRAELDGPGLFRFVTLSSGYPLGRGMLGRWRRRDPGPRLPVILGRKHTKLSVHSSQMP